MSMIHGIVRFDGRHPDAVSLHPMLDVGHPSCPDGGATWHNGCAALGLGLLHTLPRVRTASGPVRNPESGQVIVADARIDNRAELWGRLGLREGAQLNDAELLLHAYRKWGEACVEHLIGDFAFAIWDEAQRKLYCARDHFGVTHLYYANPPDSFVFSSHLPSLLALDEIPRELDEHGIADMLVGLPLAHDKTLYRGISLLPPAHCLTVGEQGFTLREYWRPQIGEPIRCAWDEEYVEAYSELLEQAITCRLETDGEVSGLLSGGLDSGAIAAIAARTLTKRGREYAAYSFVLAEGLPSRERDERELIELVHDIPGIKGHFVSTEDFHGRAADLFNMPQEYAFLGNGPHLAALFQKLNETGARVLLDGYGGDQCATCGSNIPLQEFLTGPSLVRLAHYLSASARFQGCSPTRLLLRMLRSHYLPASPMGVEELIYKRSLLAPEFRELSGIRKRAQQHWQFRRARHRSLGELLTHSLQDRKGLQHQPLFSTNRLERRFPFFDKRLIEFSLAVPAIQHSYDTNRSLIRRATHGLLPDTIRLRNDKNVNNTPGALSFLYENREHYIAAIDAALSNEAVATRIDLGKLRKRFAETLPALIEGSGKAADFMPGSTMRTFHMLMFLQRHAK